MNSCEHQTPATKKMLIEMPVEMAEALREYAGFERTSMSAIVRQLLADHLGDEIANMRQQLLLRRELREGE